jgi:hypothetical protein
VCLGTDTLPNIPLLVLCTSDVPEKLLPHDVASLFTHTHPLHYPDEEARRAFWAHFVDDVAQPPPDVAKRKKRALAVLPKAPIQPALQKVTQVEPLPDSLARPPATHTPHTTVVLTSLPQEDEQRKRVEDHYLRKLRMRFRECILSLLRERRFQPFYKPVVPTLTLALWPILSYRRCQLLGQTHGSGSSAARVAPQDPSDAPDYYEIIKSPLCLEQMLEKVDAAKYPTLPVRPPATVATLRALPDVLSCVLFSLLFILYAGFLGRRAVDQGQRGGVQPARRPALPHQQGT